MKCFFFVSREIVEAEKEYGIAGCWRFGNNVGMNVAELPIAIDRKRVARFCQERGIRRLSLFGSVLRDDFDLQRSDVDVLAEFAPGALRDSGWEYFLYGEQLAETLGHKVDFCTHLRPWLQPLVEKHALTIYDESAS